MKKFLPLLLILALYFYRPLSALAIDLCNPLPSPGTAPAGHYISGQNADSQCPGLCEWPDPTGLAQPTPQVNCYVPAGVTPSISPRAPEPCIGGECKTGLGINISTDPAGIVTQFFAILLSISGGIALVIIIISAFNFIASRGNPEKMEGARETLMAAIIGLLFTILSLLILQIIGVNLLHIPEFHP